MKHFILSLILLASIQANATHYFKCKTAVAGKYQWGTLTNWFTDPAFTTSAATLPSYADDVLFTTNTFTANGQIVFFDQTSMSSKGFTVNCAPTFTNCSFTSASGNKLSVFGHFDLTGLNATNVSIKNWNPQVEFNPQNIGTLNVLTDTKILYLEQLIVVGNPAIYTVNFNDVLTIDKSSLTGNKAIISIAPGAYTSAAAATVNFTKLVNLGTGTATSYPEIVANAGTLNFSDGIYTAYSVCIPDLSNNVVPTVPAASGGIRAFNSSIINLTQNAGLGYSQMGAMLFWGTGGLRPTLNATNQNITTLGGIYFGNSIGNFNNSTINAYVNCLTAYSNYGEYWTIKTDATMAMAGSTLNIGHPSVTQKGYFNPGNVDYNIVNVNQHVSFPQSVLNAFQFTGGLNPLFNQFNVTNPVTLIGNSNGLAVFTIKAGGVFYMAPGATYITPGAGNVHTFSISPTASVNIVGTCRKPITFKNFNINFNAMPVANLLADYLILDGSIATGTSAPFNAGANSLKIYGTTTTGWTLPCIPPARTVYWQGSLTGGNWSDYNNWSLIPSASPSAPTTPISVGACLPTYEDSVIFPDLSVVNIDVSKVYSGSIRFIATATLNPVSAILPSVVWQISGGWWATNKLKNEYNADIVFNTYRYPHLIKTGGVPFGGNTAGGGSLIGTAITFLGQYPPNGSCLNDITKHKGGWLLLDTLATNGTHTMYAAIQFYSGVLKTYNANPIYAAYYSPTQKKGSTIFANANGGNLSLRNTDTKDTVSLYDSDIYLMTAQNGNAICAITTPNFQLNEGTAEFICNPLPSTGGGPGGFRSGFSIGNGNRINELTVKSFSYIPNVSFNQMAIQNISQATTTGLHSMALLLKGDTVDKITNYQGLNIGTTLNNVAAGVTRTLTSINSNANSFLTFDSQYNGGMTNFNIDTMYTNVPTSVINTASTYSMNFTIRKLMYINGGGVTLKMGNSNAAQFDNNATITFSNNATFKSDGTCSNRNFITSYTPLGTATVYSKMILLGTINQTLTATDVQDNVVTGGILNTDGFTYGTTTNWSVVGKAPRLLHWTDGITAGGVTTDWSSVTRWRQATSGSTSPSSAPIVWGAMPECPPTCQDTVIVDDASFSGTLDSVQINTINYQAQVGKFYWRTTVGNPGFSGVPTAMLSICDSLYFSPFMSNRYRGEITLKGSSVAGTRSHGLKFANQQLKNRLIINCTNSNTTYQMRDSVYVNQINTGAFPSNFIVGNDYASVLHIQGNLKTNGNTMNMYRYTSIGNFSRKLIADNSKIRLRGGIGASVAGNFPAVSWIVANHGATKTYSISTKNTRFIISAYSSAGYGSGMIGGGYNYNDVEFYGGSNSIGRLAVNYSTVYFAGYNPASPTVVDTFRNVYNNIVPASIGDRLIIGCTSMQAGPLYTYTPVSKCIIKNVYNNTASMDIQGTHCYIDSLECLYRHPTFGVYNINTSNDYYKHLGLYGVTAPQTINLAPDSIQWLHNMCDFRPAGNASNKVNLYSSTNGLKTYIRKDTGIVCADWLVLKDIWAIGSGASLGNPTIVSIPYTCVSGTKPWLCDFDTLSTFDGVLPAPTFTTATSRTDPNFTLSKRAWFKGGNGTNFQSNNQGWEKLEKEPAPNLVLHDNSTICEGDTAVIKFDVQGVLPFNIQYLANVTTTLNINVLAPTSNTQTPATATYTSAGGYIYYMVPTTNTTSPAPGTPGNPYVLAVKVTPTVSTTYTLGYLATGKCVGDVTTLATATGSAVITVNAAPKTLVSTVTPSVICNGASVTFTANATGGSSNAYYSFATPTGTTGATVMTTQVLSPFNGTLSSASYTTGTSPTTYTVYISARNAAGCYSVGRLPLTLTVNPIPQITATSTQSICSGNTATISPVNNFTTGVINNWASASVAGITGHSTSGASNVSETLTNTTTNSLTVLYTYTPTASGCNGTAQQFSVVVNPTPTMASANATTICSGNTAAITLTSNIAGTTYSWVATDNSNTTGESITTQTTNTLSNTVVNTSTLVQTVIYSVTPTSTLGTCVGAVQQVTVTVNPSPQLTSANTATICSGGNPAISFASNVASTYTWLATNNTNVGGESTSNQTTAILNNTLTTTVGSASELVIYTVTPVSSSGACLGTAQQITVTINSLPSVTAVSSSTAICSGTTATLTASGASTYIWTSGPTATTYTVSTTGTYTVTGTDVNNCVNTNTVNLTVNTTPTVAIAATSQTICSGASTTLTASGATTYNWTNPVSTNTVVTVSPTTTTVYTVTGISAVGSCTSAAQQTTVTVNTTPTVAIASVSNSSVICSGQVATITPSGATSYTLTNTGATGTTFTVNPTANTTYSIIASTAAGCVSSNTAQTTVTVNTTPTVAIASVSNSSVICSGQVATITPSGATSYTLTNTGATGTTFTVNPTANTTYSIIASTAAGCVSSNTAQTTVTVNTTPTVAIASVSNSSVICSGQVATITPSGATSYTLTNTGATGTTFTVNPTANTTYSIIASTAAGCVSSNTAQTTVTVNTTPTVAIASVSNSSVICSGQVATITPSGATSYTLTNTGATGTTFTVNPTANTTYSIIASTAAGCVSSNTAQTTVTVNTTPTVAIASVSNSSVICSGQVATITPSGATSYTLTNTGATGTTFTVNPTANTTYSIIASTAAGCVSSNTAQTTVTVNTTPTVAIASVSNSSVICSGQIATITPSGATSYTLVNNSATGTTFTVNPTANTTYSIIASTAAGCVSSNTAQTTVTVNTTPTVAIASVSNSSVICSGQVATITPSGATSYTLTNTGATGTTFTVNPTANTTYSIIASTAAGCVSSNTAQTTVTVNTTPTVAIASVSNSSVICSGQVATITPSGATSYTLTNTGATGTTFTVNPTANTTYSIIASTAAGCVSSNTAQTTVTVNTTPTVAIASVSNSSVICSGQVATITPSGATSYTLTNTGATGTTFTVNPTANTTYSIIASTAAGCVSSNTAQTTVTVNTTPTVAIASVSNSSVICSGQVATITPSGATSYTLTNTGATGTTFTVNPTANTTYSIIASTAAGCVSSNTAQTTVTVNTTPTVAIASVSNSSVICSGQVATITPSGATSYTLTNTGATGTTFTVNPTANTTYSIIASTAAGCVSSNTAQTTVTVNTTPTVAIAATSQTICSGASTTLTASGATTYNWTNPVSTNTVVTVSPTTTTVYTVTGISAIGSCTSAAQQVTVNVNALPILATTTINNVTCFGLNNGTATFTNTSGTPGYIITGTNISGNSANSLSPGTYTYMVTDAAMCTNTLTLSITQPTASLLATAAQNATNTSCTTPDGVAGVSITGGTAGYTITPSMGIATGTTITGLGTGVHSYTITDVKGCTVSNTVSITGATGITSTLSAQANVLCNGNNTASVTVTGLGESSGIYNYTLTNTTTSLSIGTNTTGVFTNLPAGTYSANIVGNVSNCISSQNITITQPTAPLSLTGLTTNSVICNGGTAQVTTTVSGGTAPYTYIWSSANTSTTSTATYTAGAYSVNINDANGCTLATQNFTVSQAPVLAISSIVTTTTGCSLSNGSATINPTGGWSSAYTYSLNGVSQAANTVTNLASGIYTALVKDNLGCTQTSTFAIVNPAPSVVSIGVNPAPLCFGQTATLTPTGATTYTLNALTPFTTNTTVNPAVTTVYAITGTDANNCHTAVLNVTVTVNALPTMSIVATSTTLCAGSTATLTANGADTYVWTSGPTSSQNIVNAAGVYTVVGTNTTTACSNTLQSMSITVNALPVLSVSSQSNVSCFGLADGSVSFNATAGTANYTVTGASISGSNATTTGTIATGLAPNNYTYTVTDSQGCINTQTVVVTQPSAALAIIAAATGSNNSCIAPNGMATATVTGGTPTYTVNWSTGTLNSTTVTNANTGLLTYTVIDANHCTTNNSLTIVGVSGITSTISALTNILCFGNTTGSVSVTGQGGASYNYTLTNTTSTVVVGTNTSGTFANLGAANYSVNITESTSNCVSSQVFSITQPTSAIVTTPVVTNSVLCFGGTGTASLTVSGGLPTYTYSWQGNSSSTNTATYTAGIYTVNINDANGCSSVRSFTIAQPSTSLTAIATSTANSNCTTPNGAAVITATGGTTGTPAYTYSWNPSVSTASVAAGLQTGVQSYTVTDVNGCKVTNTVVVNGTATPSIAATTQTNVLCNGQNTGAAVITATNGTAPYTYAWTGAVSSTNTATNLSVGVYTATVTDAGSCKVSQTFTITQPTAMSVITNTLVSPCPEQSNGSAEIQIVGGTPTYQVNWSPAGISTTGSISTVSNIKADNYTATITDANGCLVSYHITLTSAQGDMCGITVPEIFSPNGDTKNDVWEIKGLGNYPNNKVQVFNRWGDEVYNATPYNNDWNGTNYGAKSVLGKGELPVGTYYYILDLGDGSKPMTGYVQLVR